MSPFFSPFCLFLPFTHTPWEALLHHCPWLYNKLQIHIITPGNFNQNMLQWLSVYFMTECIVYHALTWSTSPSIFHRIFNNTLCWAYEVARECHRFYRQWRSRHHMFYTRLIRFYDNLPSKALLKSALNLHLNSVIGEWSELMTRDRDLLWWLFSKLKINEGGDIKNKGVNLVRCNSFVPYIFCATCHFFNQS